MSTAPRYADDHDHDAAQTASAPPPVSPEAAPPPASDAPPASAAPEPAPRPASPLNAAESKTLLDTILHPAVFASLVDDLPDGPLRSLFKFWGGLRGLYPAEITHHHHPGRSPQLREYEIQPTEMPECADVTLSPDEVADVFEALQEAITAWERDDDVLEDMAAHRRLQRLLKAQLTVTGAWLESMRPLEHAHYEDHKAAHEWELQRWFTRARIEEHRRKQQAAAATLVRTTPGKEALRCVAAGTLRISRP